jgi:hypothetical protein
VDYKANSDLVTNKNLQTFSTIICPRGIIMKTVIISAQPARFISYKIEYFPIS